MHTPLGRNEALTRASLARYRTETLEAMAALREHTHEGRWQQQLVREELAKRAASAAVPFPTHPVPRGVR